MTRELDDALLSRIRSGQMVTDERGHLHYVTGQERRRGMLAARQHEEERFDRIAKKRPLWRKILEALR